MGDDVSQDLPMARLLSLAYGTTSRAVVDRLTAAGFDDLRPSHGNVMEHLTFEDGPRRAPRGYPADDGAMGRRIGRSGLCRAATRLLGSTRQADTPHSKGQALQ